jgi:hypothetical protein
MAINRNLSILAQGASSTGNLLNYTGANKIINGDMAIDQRNAGASVTATDYGYTLDRWQTGVSQASKFTVQQSSTVPTTGYGFSQKVTSSSAYAVLAGDIFRVSQVIEGFNTADLQWGTANAQTVTLSFWVRCSLTGTFGGSINNNAQNRSYPFSYTISAANTWEQKTVTIAGDQSGTWVGATNGVGMRVNWGLGVGSTYSGTAGAWAASQLYSVTGATSVVGTNAATWYITGVKLEVGTVATPFVPDDYGVSFQKCQRYFVKWSGTNAIVSLAYQLSSTQGYAVIKLPVSLRGAATIAYTGTPKMDFAGYSGSINGMSQAGGYGPMFDTQWIYATSTGLAAGSGVSGTLNCASDGVVTLSAEL